MTPDVQPSSGLRGSDPVGFVLRELMGLRPSDYGKTFAFLGYLLLCGAICTTTLAVRDALFLSHFDIRVLPWMFVAYGVASAIAAALHGRYADRIPRARLLTTTSCIVAAIFAAFWLLARLGQVWSFAALYVLAELTANVLLTQFRMYANDLHTSYEAKRVFGVIGSGMVLGFAVAGLALQAAVHTIGTENLLLVIAAMTLAIGGVVRLIQSRYGGQGQEQIARKLSTTAAESSWALRGAARSGQAAPSWYSQRYVWLICGLLLATGLTCTLVDYQFKFVARQVYTLDQLTAYLGKLDMLVGILAFLFHALLTGRILSGFGLRGGLWFTPLALLGSSVLLLAQPSLLTASLLKFCDVAFRCSINDASMQLLYYPFPDAAKGVIRALTEGAVAPMAFAGGGLLLAALPDSVTVRQLGVVTIPAILAWLALATFTSREYVVALGRTLRERRLGRGGAQADAAITTDMLETLAGGPNAETALVALELLRRRSVARAAKPAAGLVASGPEKVRVTALSILEELPVPEALPAIESAMAEGEREAVRRAAIGAYCALRRQAAVTALLPKLEGADRALKPDILGALIRYGGREAPRTCTEEIDRLLASESPSDRIDGLRAIARTGLSQFHARLTAHFHDSQPDVRLAAVEAAGQARNPYLVPRLAELLDERELQDPVVRALGRHGDMAVPRLGAILTDPKATQPWSLAATAALREIRTPSSLRVLLDRMDHPDERVRRSVLAAAVRLHRELGCPAVVDAGAIEQRLRTETRRAYELLLERRTVQAAWPGKLALDCLAREHQRALERISCLIDLTLDPALSSRVRLTLRHGSPVQKANALEVLSNWLPADLREPVASLFETLLPVESLEKMRRIYWLEELTPEVWLGRELDDPDPWHRIVALDLAGHYGLSDWLAKVKGALDDPDPGVREAAGWSAARLMGPAVAPLLDGLEADRDEHVRQAAALLRERYVAGSTGPACGSSVRLEQVLFMRRIDLFRSVSAEDLLAMTYVTRQLCAGPGQDVVCQGEPGDSLFLIVRGTVEVLVDGRRVNILGERACFGEMALLDLETRSATVRTLETCELLSLSQTGFGRILSDRPAVVGNVARSLTRRVRSIERELGRAAPAA